MTANGSGMLLGNPHFPWSGPNRFYEMHLTIPGQMDVMGVGIGTYPMVSIGFNKQPPAPNLPQDVIAKTQEKYLAAYELLTGKKLA